MSEAYDACNPDFTPMTHKDYLELRIERAIKHDVADRLSVIDQRDYEYLYGAAALKSFLLAARTRCGIV